LAQVMEPEGESLAGESLDRAAARMRQRFQQIKDKLKRMAEEEGLL
jgi:hypothetical protein